MKKLLSFLCFFMASTHAAEYRYPASFFSAANGNKQEDAATVAWSTVKGRHKDICLCVIDGHAGANTAKYVEQDLHKQIFEYSKSNLIKYAIEYAITEVDANARQRYTDGATVAVAYIENNCAHIFNIGDCRVILEKNGCVAFATQDHDFENTEERARILQNKGIAFRYKNELGVKTTNPWRVNGLEPLRTVGDRWQKGDNPTSKEFGPLMLDGHKWIFELYNDKATAEEKYDVAETLPITPQVGQIIADPEYTQLSLTEENRWLILATDGFTDFVSNEEAVTLVVRYFQEGKSRNDIAELLVNKAIELGSKDNVTVMVCDLLALRCMRN